MVAIPKTRGGGNDDHRRLFLQSTRATVLAALDHLEGLCVDGRTILKAPDAKATHLVHVVATLGEVMELLATTHHGCALLVRDKPEALQWPLGPLSPHVGEGNHSDG